VTARPDDAFWQSLASLRSDAPRLHLLSEKKLPYERVEAWGASRAVSAWAEERGLACPIPPWEIVRQVNSKLFSFSESPKLEGARLIYNEEELHAWIESLPGPKLLKSGFGVAGQGHFFLTPGYEEKKLRAFLEREWREALPLIGEPWVERLLDFSTQWFVGKDLQFLGATLCETDAKGVHLLNRVGEEAELFKSVQAYLDQHRQIARPILEKMRSFGYFGNVGIDAFLYKKEGTTLLHPVVEINARKTMGWAALMLQRKYFPHAFIALEYSRAGTNRPLSKLALPEKIDDFEAKLHGQRSWPGRSDEANLKKLAEELRGAWLQKGDFGGQMGFRKRSNLLPSSLTKKSGALVSLPRSLKLFRGSCETCLPGKIDD
jgi:hypothetical protein